MKKSFLLFLSIIAISFSTHAQKITFDTIKKVVVSGMDKLSNVMKGEKPLSNEEVINGLKEALRVGTDSSTGKASKVDGFYKNALTFIPFPPEVEKVKKYAEKIGMNKQVNQFVMTMNRSAEEASKEAAPVFLEAIKAMTIADGFSILKGSDSAATQYLNDKTNAELVTKFTPIIKRAIEKVQVTKYWNPIITSYNKVPGVEKKNPNLEQYITQRSIQGLFKLLAIEEKKIRVDPLARVNDILKRVFGSKK
jgi:hypothetical protein